MYLVWKQQVREILEALQVTYLYVSPLTRAQLVPVTVNNVMK